MAELPEGQIPRVKLPRPFPIQARMLNHAARRKLLRWGRRSSKTRCAFLGSSAGHGPLGASPWGASYGLEPMHRGFIRGGTIAWIGIGYDQTRKVWEEEFLPRFQGVPGFTVHEGDYRIQAPPVGPDRIRGEITIYTSSNVASLLGSKLHGVVCDEFAHWERDPRDAWRRVLRFTLLDYRGWAMFPSTPNPGSYYDELCAKYPDGADDLVQPATPSKVWFQTHHTAFDNPRLSPIDIRELIEEYETGDPNLDTEVYAKLITGGGGLAFPNFNSLPDAMVHVVKPTPLPRFWRPVASMDWGFKTGVICDYSLGPEGETIQTAEYPLAELHARDAGKAYIDQLLELGRPIPELVAYDQQMDYEAGQGEGTSLADEFREGMLESLQGNAEALPAMIGARKGPGSRIAGWNLVRRALSWEDSRDARGKLNPWAAPRFRVFTACPATIQEFTRAINDAKVHGDVDNKRSVTHRLDCIRYLLAVQAQGGEPPPRDVPQDVSPGIDRHGELRQRRTPAPWEQQRQGPLYEPPPGDFFNPADGAGIDYEEE